MNHLEELTTEWLDYNGYFTRNSVRVGPRPLGGYDGELDVIGYHPETGHFVHVECSMDALTWDNREKRFARKLAMGREYAASHFNGIGVLGELDQIVVLGFVSAVEKHRSIGGGRLVTSSELVAEIACSVPKNNARSAVPENFPLLRTLQLAVVAGAQFAQPACTVIPAIAKNQ
ncbi:MAG: hypothetical protein KDK08_27380 [Rhizobiaceae bacterium]|nr:hypothetical protein [Rhizobiaceae bacterium]